MQFLRTSFALCQNKQLYRIIFWTVLSFCSFVETMLNLNRSWTRSHLQNITAETCKTHNVSCLLPSNKWVLYCKSIVFLSWDKNNWCEYLQPQICPEYITPSPQVISPLDPNISSPVCNATKKCLQTFLSPALIFRILRSLVAR